MLALREGGEVGRAGSAGSTFLAEETACAKPLIQENARDWQRLRAAGVAAARRGEEAGEAEVRGGEGPWPLPSL